MKINSTLSYLKDLYVFSGVALVLGFAQSCAVSNMHPTENKKPQSSPKEKEIKIYPDVMKKVTHVKNAESVKIDFFVFDREGAIMIHYKMNGKEHKKIHRLEKGIYTYQVFKNDEMTESGKIIIK
ncbi:MAG TPA: T9SS type A sorting domain-containing protein [Chitinophagaceae bacterium]|nr:T9SS type A sorting domain-containing protein [Chitinophagaceae bacterium]